MRIPFRAAVLAAFSTVAILPSTAAAWWFPAPSGPALSTPFYLDAHAPAADADGYTPAATSPKALAKNDFFVVSASGTYSVWNSANIGPSSPFTVCGAPEPAPRFIGADGGTGYVGADPEVRFAYPTTAACQPTPIVTTAFEISTGGAFADLPAIAGGTNHTYEYVVKGQGKALQARIYDPAPQDNYGSLKLVVRKAGLLDCLDKGWKDFPGVSSLGECALKVVL